MPSRQEILDTDRLPVIIGVAQATSRGESNREPLDLIAEAAAAALDDGHVAANEPLAAINIVQVISWVYDDLAGRLATRLGRSASRTSTSAVGGEQPTRLVAAAGRRAAADGGIHLIAGGEAMRSAARANSTGETRFWTAPPPGARAVQPQDFVTSEMLRHGLVLPPAVYALYEHGLRARLGHDRATAQAWSAQLWAQLSMTAARRPGAWIPRPVTPERLLEIDADNRMISDPYPKLMTAMLAVDQAAAVVVTTVGTARRLGVKDEHMIHLWADAGAVDADDVLARVDYAHSPAMDRVLDDLGTAAGTGTSRDAFSFVELYSCFPCVPKMALSRLGWDPKCSISVTGGLTFFGGPGNAYMLAAIAAMTDELRNSPADQPALLYGQGAFVTKHHALVVGSGPRPGGALPFDDENSRQRAVDDEPHPELACRPHGPGQIETFTVEYARDGSPTRAIVIGHLDDRHRFVANDDDPSDIAELLGNQVESIGRTGYVVPGNSTAPNRFRLT